MRFGFGLRRLVAFAAVVLACATALPAQSFDLVRDREPLVSLDGHWRFHPGDSPPDPTDPQKPLWAEHGFDDSTWPLLDSNRSWSEQGYQDMSGYAWYRFTISIPADSQPASLMLAPIMTSFQVFIDGRLVGKSGQMPPTIIPNTRISHQVFPLTESASASARTLQVAIRVWHSPIWADYVGGGP